MTLSAFLHTKKSSDKSFARVCTLSTFSTSDILVRAQPGKGDCSLTGKSARKQHNFSETTKAKATIPFMRRDKLENLCSQKMIKPRRLCSLERETGALTKREKEQIEALMHLGNVKPKCLCLKRVKLGVYAWKGKIEALMKLGK